MSECSNCGHEVSASAWECKNCGSNMPTAETTIAKVLIVVVVVGLIVMLIAL